LSSPFLFWHNWSFFASVFGGKERGGAGYRSLCLMHAKHALYHLSYTPTFDVKSGFLRRPEFFVRALVLSCICGARLKFWSTLLAPFELHPLLVSSPVFCDV